MNTILLSKMLSNIFESKLFELARSRSEAKSKISSYDTVLAEHIVKCIIFPNSIHRVHWLKEVNSYLLNVNRIRIKPSKQKFSSKEYMKMLWEPELETVPELEDIVKAIKQKNNNEVVGYKELDYVFIHKKIKEIYQNNICELISKNSFEPLGIHIFDL